MIFYPSPCLKTSVDGLGVSRGCSSRAKLPARGCDPLLGLWENWLRLFATYLDSTLQVAIRKNTFKSSNAIGLLSFTKFPRYLINKNVQNHGTTFHKSPHKHDLGRSVSNKERHLQGIWEFLRDSVVEFHSPGIRDIWTAACNKALWICKFLKWGWVKTLSEHQNSWDLWMFIPLKMVCIGIDP